MSNAVTGNDSASINGRILNDLADQNALELTFPNEIASVKTGKNGNAIYSLNETGKQAEVKIRVLRGTPDDKFLNGLMAQQQANFNSFPLMFGEFIKKVGDGTGFVGTDKYIMGGGIFSKLVEGKMNVEGESEQSVSIYTLKFANAPRVIT